MAYNKINWEDAPSTATPLDAENLNHMDDGIYSNSKALNDKLNKMPFDTVPTKDSPNYITSGTVYDSVSKKADKESTLAGYGITDAYDKTYLDRALKNKLDKMPFDTTPKVNSPNYITSGTLYNSVSALNQTIATKYDKSNIDSGTGSLTPGQDIYAGSEGSFNYTKNGLMVTVSVNITKLIADKSYLQLAGLPFAAKKESDYSSIAVYSTTNKLRNIRILGTWLIISAPIDKFAEDEKINFIITYIRR